MWNYRIVRKKTIWTDPEDRQERVSYTYCIHEAFYDKNGFAGSITEEPVHALGENIAELRHDWLMMAEAFGKPILDFDRIPEPGYDRRSDPVAMDLDQRLADREDQGIPWADLKKKLEAEWGPFDSAAYDREREAERLEQERLHGERFVGSASLAELIDKIRADYQEWLAGERQKWPVPEQA